MVRRVDPHGEVLVSCSGCARCRLGPELMNRCRSEKIDTKQNGKMFKPIFIQEEEERVRDRNARRWKVEGEKRRATRKECIRAEGGLRSWRFQSRKRVVEHHPKENAGRKRSTA